MYLNEGFSPVTSLSTFHFPLSTLHSPLSTCRDLPQKVPIVLYEKENLDRKNRGEPIILSPERHPRVGFKRISAEIEENWCIIDCNMTAIDWTKIYKKYKGLWVALKDDEQTVISFGKTLQETANKAKDKGFKKPIFMKIPQNVGYFTGKILK